MSRNANNSMLTAAIRAIAKGLDPILVQIVTRLRAVEKKLEDKGIGTPGVAVVDPTVVQYIEDRLWKTERRIDAIETDPTLMRDADVWEPERGYKAGSVVTYKGLMWRARCGTDTRPGGPDWRMLHKHARPDREK